jgi:hypothetical protein
VGAGIADDDGDGYKEVFARLNAKLVTAEIVDQLESYVTAKLQAADLRPSVQEILDNLYTRTNPIVVRSIGQPYDVAGVGTIAYPLAVIEHQSAGHVINVLLMSP